MAESHGVAIIPIIVPPDRDEPIKIHRLSNPQGKGHEKLDKHVVDSIHVDAATAFVEAFNKLPIDGGMIHRSFATSYTYSRPTSDHWGVTRRETRIHTYLVALRPEQYHGDESSLVEPPISMSFASELKAVGAAAIIVHNKRETVDRVLQTRGFGALPYERDWVTYDELMESRSFRYGWELRFEDPDELPWMDTEPSFGEPYTKEEIEAAVDRRYQLGYCPGQIYCHNHRCEKGDITDELEADTVLDMKVQSPQKLPLDERDRLEEMGEQRVSVDLHEVSDGEYVYLLVGPNIDSGELELSGWFCSTECIESVPWPTDDHIAVAAELCVPIEVDQPPGSVPPVVSDVRGVYSTEPNVLQTNLSSFSV